MGAFEKNWLGRFQQYKDKNSLAQHLLVVQYECCICSVQASFHFCMKHPYVTYAWVGTVKTLYQGFPNRGHKNACEALENAREASEDPARLKTYKCLPSPSNETKYLNFHTAIE